jgi:hypothetical protein
VVLGTRRALASVLVLLGAVAPADGARFVPPWTDGASRVTPFEAAAGRVAGALADHRVSVECVDREAWRALARRYGFALETWAMTPLRLDAASGRPVAEGRTVAAPRTCRNAAAFAADPSERGARLCRHGTRTGECDDWGLKLVAVHVLTHESMHLAGVIDEAAAECFAVQTDAYVATRLGATSAFARSVASEYWASYYRGQDPGYRSAECRDGGALDLFPGRPGWPTPGRYPRRLAAAIAERASAGDGIAVGS